MKDAHGLNFRIIFSGCYRKKCRVFINIADDIRAYGEVLCWAYNFNHIPNSVNRKSLW